MNQSEYNDRIILLREELCNEYSPYVSPIILNQYKIPEKRIIVNDNDPDLYPIPLHLPDPPPYHTIDGFGLRASEQYFRPPKIPMKIQDLLKRIGAKSSITDIWGALEKNKVYYKDEIRWIHLQWHYRLNGYWFFNNGIPTYIDGWHWLYLSYWQIDNDGIPKYRYRDRIFFLFARYCYTTTEAPYFFRVPYDDDYEYFSDRQTAEKFIADNKLLLRPEAGRYVVDFGTRTLFGFNYPKHRREGATARGALINFDLVSTHKSVHGGIQSKDEKSAQQHVYLDKIIKPFKNKNYPFFFKPLHKTSFTTELVFDKIMSISSNGGAAIVETGLESMIKYDSAGERQFDGDKLIRWNLHQHQSLLICFF